MGLFRSSAQRLPNGEIILIILNLKLKIKMTEKAGHSSPKQIRAAVKRFRFPVSRLMRKEIECVVLTLQ
jgi:hypothetical protein